MRSSDPTELGGYEILGRLGEGGQGTVFLGRPAGAPDGLPPESHVAVKLLHGGLAGDDSARARFVRELDVAKRVARFCTAQVLDADVAGDQPYIVSEYVPGVSLHQVVRTEGPRTGGALERLAVSTLTALTAIHQAGIVHRDFKPHNVMMGPDGPRVIDFGVARALGTAGETQNIGTPAYMAPEHFTGGEVGPASDMFAWGTTMVFAATGRPAFGNDEMGTVMHRILTGEPDLGDLSGPLRDLVLACLDKEPARRPTARAAQERLVGAASGSPAGTPVQPPPFPGPPVHALLPPDRPGAPADPSGIGSRTAPQPPPFDEQQPPPAHPAVHTRPQGAPGAAPAGFPAAPGPRGPGGTSGGQAGGKRRGLLIPIAAAAAVLAVIAGGAAWAATRTGDGGGGDRQAAASGQGNGPQGASESVGGMDDDGDQSPAEQKHHRPEARQSKDPAGQNRSRKPGATRKPGSPTPTRGGGGGGDSGTDKEPPNKYSPQSVCNSGGHGGGYYVQRSLSVSGGTAYLLYNSSTYNCAVMIKTKDVGRTSPASVWIQKKGGSTISDSGQFAWYAGPVYVKAPGTCVRFGGNGRSAPYGNCG
ncbi:serine/threonine protein kinase [Actinomadura welshii]